MSDYFNITESAIKWAPEESSYHEDEKGKISISIVGYLPAETVTFSQARSLVPDVFPYTADGAFGDAPSLIGAKRTTVKINPADACWKVEAGYETVTGTVTTDDEGNDLSDKDKFRRSASPNIEPILASPVAQQFTTSELLKLKLLIDGKIIPNIEYGLGGATSEALFVTENPNDEFKFTKPVTFSSTNVTVNGITASPLDYAKAIRAGVTSYQTNSVKHIVTGTRDQPFGEAVYNRLQTVVGNPPGAIGLGRGRQWLFESLEESSNTDGTWSFTATYGATGDGGALKMLYKGGNYELA